MQEGVFVELNSELFGGFFVLGFGGFYLVFAVEVAADPEEAGCGTFVDNETRWITTDGLHRLFDGGETIFGSGGGLLLGGGF